MKSLQNGFSFDVDNKAKGVSVVEVSPIEIDGRPWPVSGVSFVTEDSVQQAKDISSRRPWKVPQGRIMVRVQGRVIDRGLHDISLPFRAEALGQARISFRDAMEEET